MMEYNELIGIRDKIAFIEKRFLEGNYYNRLVMTDDIVNFKSVVTRAKETKEEFFHGLGLPSDLQNMVDDLVRNHKDTLLRAIELNQLNDLGLCVKEFDEAQTAHVLTFPACGMGFYLSPRKRRDRSQLIKPSDSLRTLTDQLKNTGGKGRGKIVLGKTKI